MVTISTLKDHLDYGYGLTLFCSCGHSLDLSLPKMIEIFGENFSIVSNRDYFLGRFRCNDCRRRPITVHLKSPNVPKGW